MECRICYAQGSREEARGLLESKGIKYYPEKRNGDSFMADLSLQQADDLRGRKELRSVLPISPGERLDFLLEE